MGSVLHKEEIFPPPKEGGALDDPTLNLCMWGE